MHFHRFYPPPVSYEPSLARVFSYDIGYESWY